MKNVTIALTGSGGTGVVALGEMVLQVAARLGLYGILRKTFGPQIRGGESAAIVRLGPRPLASFGETIDLLLVLDWTNFQRFADEIPLTDTTLIIEDTAAGTAPAALQSATRLDFSGLARQQGSAHSNIAALGYLGSWLGCDGGQIERALEQRLQHHGADTLALIRRVAQAGSHLHTVSPLALAAPAAVTGGERGKEREQERGERWLATGNQLAGLGALEAGIRFVAAYPITPASDALEWMAGRIEQQGGHLVQAEDELAAINMAIGAGFGGVPAMTATSGPGLALMAEAMGLAVASETPLVILNVMRGGPSTGIPTKSEQSDFNLAVYGLHGDAPHVVMAALTIADCHHTLGWAVAVASERQTLSIVLSDQFLGQSMQILPPLAEGAFKAEPVSASLPPAEGGDYFRYLNTDNGVSPVALPGQAGGMYTADGLEHSEQALPSAKAQDHQTQLDKRQRKLESLVDSPHWGECCRQQGAELLILCFGSLYPIALEAQQILLGESLPVNVVGIRLLSPPPLAQIRQCMDEVKQVVVIEQNHQGQFARYLSSFGLSFCSYHRPGPRLFTPGELVRQVKEMRHAESQAI